MKIKALAHCQVEKIKKKKKKKGLGNDAVPKSVPPTIFVTVTKLTLQKACEYFFLKSYNKLT